MIIAFRTNGEIVGIYLTLTEAVNQLGIDGGNISKVLTGELNKTANHSFIQASAIEEEELKDFSDRIKFFNENHPITLAKFLEFRSTYKRKSKRRK
jgi:hypothetical protein